MPRRDTQLRLFQYLKSILPAHLSLADEVADLLQISPDSAYRRIRGEKPISLDELETICLHYKMSADRLMQLQTDSFLFSGKLIGNTEDDFDNWLDQVHQQLKFMNSFSSKHMYWLLKDIPPMEHFHVPELASFKFYLWKKSILRFESMKGVKFDPNDRIYTTYHDKSRKMLDVFLQLPTTEIWNIESINSTLRQIRFHDEAGSFKSKDDVRLLYQKVIELVDHIEMQAEYGVKFRRGDNPALSKVPFDMFVNELILGDNCILLDADNLRMTFLNHSVLFFIYTRDEVFNNKMFDNLQNLINKSTMISRVGGKERATFFNRLRETVQGRMAY
jgi:hypothetical protein